MDAAVEWAREHGFDTEILRQREEQGAVSHHIIVQWEPDEAIPGTFRSNYDGWPDKGISATFAERGDTLAPGTSIWKTPRRIPA